MSAPVERRTVRVLAAQAVGGDDGAVALDVDALHVIEHAATLADQLQQATTAVVVFLVGLEVASEVVDAAGEQRDLHLGRARVALVELVLVDDVLICHEKSLPEGGRRGG